MGITHAQALDCLASDDLIGIGMEADAVRRSVHPDSIVSYGLGGSIVFEELKKATESSETDVSAQWIASEVQAVLHAGGTGVRVFAGNSAELRLEWCTQTFRAIKQCFPRVCLCGLSASEVVLMAERARLSVHDTLRPQHDSGLDLLAGEDAEILDDTVRAQTAPLRCCSEDWLAVHRTAHGLGLCSTATMRFGAGETAEQRVRHLELLRSLQAETGGFRAFIPMLFRPIAAPVRGEALDEPTSVEYLKTLAVSRMLLDNFDNIETSWATQGLKVMGMGLRFGCNDVGSLHVAKTQPVAAASKTATEEELRRVIRDAGFTPVQRDTLYRTMFLN